MYVPTYYYYGIIIINSTSWALERIRIFLYTHKTYVAIYAYMMD